MTTLYKPLKLAFISMPEDTNVLLLLDDMSSFLIMGCYHSLKGLPMLGCVTLPDTHYNAPQCWLLEQEKEVHELYEAFESREHEWFVWSCLETVEGCLQALTKGTSEACGCAVPQAPKTSSAGASQRLWKTLHGSAGAFCEHTTMVLYCLHGLYALNPAHSAWEPLQRHFQKQQLEQGQQQGVSQLAKQKQQDQQQGVSQLAKQKQQDQQQGASEHAKQKQQDQQQGLQGNGLEGLQQQQQTCHEISREPLAAGGEERRDVDISRIEVEEERAKADRMWLLPIWLLPVSFACEPPSRSSAPPASAASSSSAQSCSSHLPRPAAAGTKAGAAQAKDAPAASRGEQRMAKEHAEGITADRLQLLVNVLLLSWPPNSNFWQPNSGWDTPGKQESTSGALGGSSKSHLLHSFHIRQGWGWLLLLVAMLQQAPASEKQQLLQRPAGRLLLQLLYRVLLDQEELDKGQEETPVLLVGLCSLGDILAGWQAAGGSSLGNTEEAEGTAGMECAACGVKAGELVLMVLQALLLVGSPAEAASEDQLLEYGLALRLEDGKHSMDKSIK
jgi:hypothetical protein